MNLIIIICLILVVVVIVFKVSPLLYGKMIIQSNTYYLTQAMKKYCKLLETQYVFKLIAISRFATIGPPEKQSVRDAIVDEMLKIFNNTDSSEAHKIIKIKHWIENTYKSDYDRYVNFDD